MLSHLAEYLSKTLKAIAIWSYTLSQHARIGDSRCTSKRTHLFLFLYKIIYRILHSDTATTCCSSINSTNFKVYDTTQIITQQHTHTQIVSVNNYLQLSFSYLFCVKEKKKGSFFPFTIKERGYKNSKGLSCYSCMEQRVSHSDGTHWHWQNNVDGLFCILYLINYFS